MPSAPAHPASAGRSRGSLVIANWCRRPPVLLALLSLASLGLRGYRLDQPPGLAGDEFYYVNAARDIAGVHSAASPLPFLGNGVDSNPAHPPLAKLLMAGSIHLFGDTPAAWRLPSVLAGSAALLLLYWVIRSAGGRPALGLTAVGLLAADNLFLVHGRLATLDILVAALMLLAAGLYLRGRWVLAGIAGAAAACAKLVAGDLLLVLLLLELGQMLRDRPWSDPGSGGWLLGAARRWCGFAAVSAAAYLTLLAGLDVLAGIHVDPVRHSRFMLSALSTRGTRLGPGGSAINISDPSSPWQWMLNQVPINYWRSVSPGGGRLDFRGEMNPLVILPALPALALAVRSLRREPDGVALLGLAWFAGTMLPFTLGAALGRTSYLYYMLIVLPAVVMAVARCFFAEPRIPIRLRAVYVVALLLGLAAVFPFRP